MNTVSVLKDAIVNARTASFYYDDRPRIVEVHALGKSNKDQSIIMRGYQVAGESSRPLPCWALFTIDKIDAPTLSAFVDSEAPREGYKMNDKHMIEIIEQVNNV